MRAAILQSNYLPWKGYFDLIQEVDVFIFYDEAQYTKNDWRNRNRICSKNGPHWLTIPIPKDATKLRISEVRLPDSGWQERHLKTLTHAYKSAPYFAQIEPLLQEIYKSVTWSMLSDLNRFCIAAISNMLGFQTTFLSSRRLNLSGGRVERLIGMLRQIGADEYLSGSNAKAYLSGSEGLFEDAGIKLSFKEYNYPEYKQLHSPFDHRVSIIDVLANVPLTEVKHYITSAK